MTQTKSTILRSSLLKEDLPPITIKVAKLPSYNNEMAELAEQDELI